MKKYIFLTLLAMATTHSMAQEFDFKEVTYTPKETTFKLFAPRNAKSVKVEYDVNTDTATALGKPKAVKMKCGKDGIWQAVVKRNLNHHDTVFALTASIPWAFLLRLSERTEALP